MEDNRKFATFFADAPKGKKIGAVLSWIATVILLVALFGMFAFLFVNSDNLSNFKIAVIGIGIELDFIVMAGMVWHYIINIDKLEDL